MGQPGFQAGSASRLPSGSPSGTTRYRPGLDGLRALAVVAVLLYHAGVRWVPGGFLGVDLFFVISGFLITTLLIAEVERTGRICLASFFKRRARRLLPALGLVLVVTTAALVLFWPQEVAKVRGDIVASLGYVANWWFIVHHQSYFQATGRPSPLQHLWSLAVEEQFYLVWPATVALILGGSAGIRRLKVVAAVACGGAAASTALMAVIAVAHNVPYGADASRVYYGTDTHAIGVLLGSGAAALAIIAARQGWMLRFRNLLDVLGALGLAGVCWAMVHTNEFMPALYRGGFLVFAAMAAFAVVATGREGSWLETALGQEPLRWLGTRSYGLYLWHWPIFVFTRPQLDVAFTKGGDMLLRLALTVAAAEASYRFVEQPIRAKGLRAWVEGVPSKINIPKTWRTATAIYAACLLIGLGAGLFLVSRHPASRAPAAVGQISAHRGAGAPKASPSPAQPANPAQATPPPQGAQGAQPAWSLTAVGDSVMLGATPELKRAFPGAVVDAVEGRQATDAFATIEKLLGSGHLGKNVILQTGTNGTIDPAVLRSILAKLAGRRVIILNVHVPRPWQNSDNATLEAAVRANGVNGVNGVNGANGANGKVYLLDWNAAASAHPQWFWNDGVHLRGTGAQQYADLIAAALR